MPASSPGNMGGSVREPALSVALWLSWGAVLGAVTCAVALLIQQTELQSLRKEVSRLQRSGGPSQKRGECPWQSLWKQVSKGRWESQGEGRMAEGVLRASQSSKFQVGARGGLGFGSQGNRFQENKLLKINVSCTKNALESSQCPDRGLGQVQRFGLFLVL